MEIVNCTAHTINEVCTGRVIKPSGIICRVATETKQTGVLDNIPVFETKPTGLIQGLPEPKKDTVYIVSAMALSFIKNRDDVFTVGSLNRDKDGNVVGCSGLRK